MFHWTRPTAAQLGAGGLKPSDFPEPVADVWPENWPVISLYARIATQWRCGPGGPIGLDYTVVYRELDQAGITGDDWTEAMDLLRVVEAAALTKILEA